MSSVYLRQAPPSPPEATSEATVQVYALQAGHFSLPERFFVHPASDTARRTVPSLSFLIVHQNQETDHTTRIVFDLGLRRDVNRYPLPIQKHIDTRQPLTTLPDVTKSLAAGGLSPNDIDYVIYSHVSGWLFVLSVSIVTDHYHRYTGIMLESLGISHRAHLSLETEQWICYMDTAPPYEEAIHSLKPTFCHPRGPYNFPTHMKRSMMNLAARNQRRVVPISSKSGSHIITSLECSISSMMAVCTS
jgi:hypothetical protein